MTTSPEHPEAAPWHSSHESSRAATSTMVAAGLVTAAALMAFVGLLVTGDEVSALVAAMVMLVAGANTWSAGRSRTWWRADPVTGHEARPAPAPLAPTGAAPVRSSRPVVRDRPVGPPIAERPSRPAETRSRPAAPAASTAPAPPPAPRPQVSVPAAAAAVPPAPAVRAAPAVPAPAPAVPAPAPAVVRLTAVSAAPPRGSQPARVAAPGPADSAAPITTVAHRHGPDEHVTSSRAERTAPASASRARRRTAPVRPVSRRVAGTRSS